MKGIASCFISFFKGRNGEANREAFSNIVSFFFFNTGEEENGMASLSITDCL